MITLSRLFLKFTLLLFDVIPLNRLSFAMAAFLGTSRTLTEQAGSSKDSKLNFTSAFEFSKEDYSRTMSDLDEFYHETLMKNESTKNCFKIDIRNNVTTEAFGLRSKESKSAFKKISEKLRGYVYNHHTIIYLIYVPTMLESTQGLMTLKLYNQNTQEIIDIDTDAPANEACVYITRWPRSVHVDDGEGICILPSIVCPSFKQGAIAGTLYPVWDDTVERKKLYEKEYPSLRFPISKTDAMSGVKNIGIIKQLTKQRLLGGNGVVDVSPQTIDIKGEPGKKAKTVNFKRLESSSIPLISSNAEDSQIVSPTLPTTSGSDSIEIDPSFPRQKEETMVVSAPSIRREGISSSGRHETY